MSRSGPCSQAAPPLSPQAALQRLNQEWIRVLVRTGYMVLPSPGCEWVKRDWVERQTERDICPWSLSLHFHMLATSYKRLGLDPRISHLS